MNRIVSFSGGKDSTALLLKCLEKGKKIHSVVFFDTGWEFPEMYRHIEKVENYTGITIRKFKPKMPFLYYMLERKIYSKKGIFVRKGRGWPSINRRWCTGLKQNRIQTYLNLVPNALSYIGYSYDELDRAQSFLNNKKNKASKVKTVFPLIKIKMTAKDNLNYCYKHGFDWEGLYTKHNRVSCFCCPLQSLWDLKKLKIYHPHLWNKMLEWESKISGSHIFKYKETVANLDIRFEKEFKKYLTKEKK